MKTVSMDDALRQKVVAALGRAPLFHGLKPEQIGQVVGHAQLVQFGDEEVMVKQGDPSDSLYLLLSGEASVRIGSSDEGAEISRVRPPETFGEIGLLLDHARTANVVSMGDSTAVRFDRDTFQSMFSAVPYFGLVTARALAARLARASMQIPLPSHDETEGAPDPAVVAMIPVPFLERHRVLPLSVHGSTLTLGCVGDPGTSVLFGARQFVPGMDIRPVRISSEMFDSALRARAGILQQASAAAPEAAPPRTGSPDLDRLLERMVAEGASDLHLSAGHPPYWRIDGELHPLTDARPLETEEVRAMLQPVMDDRHREELDSHSDTDFAYSVPGLARFRVNAFRDQKGASAVLRFISDTILSFEQLGLPKAVQQLCDSPSGLVLITGPTGSGKSTTIASMIDSINQARRCHIITLEDPVEFLHRSAQALVNQREVGSHTESFATALRAALREDPDVILVGEMRDPETMALTLEAASTGHLVFATVHTATAASTVDRILSTFPSGEQEQARVMLAESLRGVVCQTLCRRTGGGRVAALEVMIVNHAIANLLREGKTHQIENAMVTSRKEGNMLLNESLERLVRSRRIAKEESFAKAIDKADMRERLAAPVQRETS